VGCFDGGHFYSLFAAMGEHVGGVWVEGVGGRTGPVSQAAGCSILPIGTVVSRYHPRAVDPCQCPFVGPGDGARTRGRAYGLVLSVIGCNRRRGIGAEGLSLHDQLVSNSVPFYRCHLTATGRDQRFMRPMVPKIAAHWRQTGKAVPLWA
jgi:hypothetical protein